MDIYLKVRLLNISTYREIVDRPQLVERGESMARQEREAYEKDKWKDKKTSSGGFRGQSISKRPP